jgi:hypothetical protein
VRTRAERGRGTKHQRSLPGMAVSAPRDQRPLTCSIPGVERLPSLWPLGWSFLGLPLDWGQSRCWNGSLSSARSASFPLTCPIPVSSRVCRGAVGGDTVRYHHWLGTASLAPGTDPVAGLALLRLRLPGPPRARDKRLCRRRSQKVSWVSAGLRHRGWGALGCRGGGGPGRCWCGGGVLRPGFWGRRWSEDSRAGGRRERVRWRYAAVFAEAGGCGRPRSSVAPGGFTEMSNARNEGHGP